MSAIATTPMPDGGAMPVFGIGTWELGNDPQRADTEIAAIRAGLEAGLTLIDTAEMYASGRAEQVVSRAIEGFERDSLTIVTKVLPSNASRTGTIEACERSLRNLRTDRIEIYLLHWTGTHPLEDTVEAFERLKADGKIRAWGVSNFDVDDLEELETVSGGCMTNQVLYNLSRRGVEYDLLGWCAERSMPVMAYSPIEQGRLAGSGPLGVVAERHGATRAQVALAFLLARPGVVVIPKTASAERMAENLKALDLTLDEEDTAELDRAFPPPTKKSALEMI